MCINPTRTPQYPLVKAINLYFRIYHLVGPAGGIASVLSSALLEGTA